MCRRVSRPCRGARACRERSGRNRVSLQNEALYSRCALPTSDPRNRGPGKRSYAAIASHAIGPWSNIGAARAKQRNDNFAKMPAIQEKSVKARGKVLIFLREGTTTAPFFVL